MVCAQVFGNDTTIAFCRLIHKANFLIKRVQPGYGGKFSLQSAQLLGDACVSL